MTSIIAITAVLTMGLSNTAFAEHNPNHDPPENANTAGNIQETISELQSQIISNDGDISGLQDQDNSFQVLIDNLQVQINYLTTTVTDGLATLSTALTVETDARIAADDSLQTQIDDDADSDPTNEINPQIGGTRNLIGDGGGTAQIDCLIGEIKLYAGSHVPSGFIPAHGQILNINENFNLYAILLTNYGGDGRVTFGIPDFRSVEPNDVGGSQNDNAHYIICADGILPLPPRPPA